MRIRSRAGWIVIAGCLIAGCLEAKVIPCGDQICPTDSTCTPSGCVSNDVFAIRIEPTAPVLVAKNFEPVSVELRAFARHQDGHEEDVTARALFELDDPIASIDGLTATADGTLVGATPARIAYGNLVAETTLTVRRRIERLDDTVSVDLPAQFAGATLDASRTLQLAYPPDTVVIPVGIGTLEFQWSAPYHDRFELLLETPFVDFAVYTSRPQSIAISDADWAELATRRDPITATVSGLATSDPSTRGESTPRTIFVPDEVATGSMYFWSITGGEGLMRLPLPARAEPIAITVPSFGSCAGCHTPSEDGRWLSIQGSSSAMLEIATGEMVIPPGQSGNWATPTFGPGGSRFIAVTNNAFVVRETVGGAQLATLAIAGGVAHPAWSPDGTRVAYTKLLNGSGSSGEIAIVDYNPVTHAVSAPRTVIPVDSSPALFPSFSPDGRWIAGLRNLTNPGFAPGGEIWIARADGTGVPIPISPPNLPQLGITTRFSQFEFTLRGEPVMFLVTTALGQYGIHPDTTQMIWLVPFFPERAEVGGNPSGPALWFPSQVVGTSNFFPQWTL